MLIVVGIVQIVVELAEYAILLQIVWRDSLVRLEQVRRIRHVVEYSLKLAKKALYLTIGPMPYKL